MKINLTKVDAYIIIAACILGLVASFLGYFISSIFVFIGILWILILGLLVYLQTLRSKEKTLVKTLQELSEKAQYKQNKQIATMLQQQQSQAQSKAQTERNENPQELENPHSYPIIISSTQHPHYGGAATNAYKLVKYFRKNGFKTAGLFFTNYEVDVLDPDQIGGIWNLPYVREDNMQQKAIRKQLEETNAFCSINGKAPIIFAKNLAAPLYCKKLYPESEVNYLVSGCWHLDKLVNDGLNISAMRFLQSEIPVDENRVELQTMELAKHVIPNSEILKKLLEKLHPEFSHKITQPINTSQIVELEDKSVQRTSWKSRDIDLLFAASSMNRKIKNAELAQRIFAHPDFAGLKKVVIGDDADAFQDIPNTQVFERSPQDLVISQMARAKVVLCTSYFDANPNVVSEAIYMGCHVVVSKNVGQSERYPREWVCEDVYQLEEWVEKVKFILKTPSQNLRAQILPSTQKSLLTLI